MSKNKQQTAVEFFYKEVWVSFHNKLSWSECERLNKIEEQAKAMHKEEMKNFTEDWYHNGPLLGVDVLVSTSIEKHYNETFGGNNEQ